MKAEKRKVRIMTLRGRIFTITISKKTDTQIFGIDKFGDDVIISVEDIKSMTPYDLNKRGVSIKN